MKQKNEGGNLSRMKSELERRLVVMRYNEQTAKNYMRILGWVQEFIAGYGETSYSKEAGQRFIAEYTLQAQHSPTYFRAAKTVVRRMDEILDGKLFAPRFCEPNPDCPLRFAEWRTRYFNYLRERGLGASTIGNHERHVNRLLGRLAETVRTLGELSAADLYDALTRFEPRTNSMSVTKCFLAYLFENGVTKSDLSVCIPRERRPRPMPSVYSGAEVSRLLSSVDRSDATGKRDYAMLMLAAQLGLRSSDIVNLSFEDIDHTNKTIDIVQVKTGRPMTLVLNPDVEEALDDYIANGRPHSSSKNIFLGSQAPYAPLTPASGYAIAHRHFERANIAHQGRRRGTHALRTSYATALVTKGVPYSVVQEALGHDDPESSKYYVRVDVRRLRACAINVPKPTGAFAVNLCDLEGRLW